MTGHPLVDDVFYAERANGTVIASCPRFREWRMILPDLSLESRERAETELREYAAQQLRFRRFVVPAIQPGGEAA